MADVQASALIRAFSSTTNRASCHMATASVIRRDQPESVPHEPLRQLEEVVVLRPMRRA